MASHRFFKPGGRQPPPEPAEHRLDVAFELFFIALVIAVFFVVFDVIDELGYWPWNQP